jgi:D-xylose transport system permease protein
MLIFKVAAIAILGGLVVLLLSVNRGQALLAIEGVPIVIPIVLVILVVGTFVLDRTVFGRYIYAVGGNPEAARRAGIKVAQIRLYAFVICSTLAVVSGVLQASRIGSIESTAGRSIVLEGVAAAVVGGVSLFGGRGRLVYAAVGAMVISIIDNGLGLIGLPAGANFLITGGVLVAAATVDALSRRRSGVSIIRI